MKLQLLRLKRRKNCALSNNRHFAFHYPPWLIMKEAEKKKEKEKFLVDMILRW